MTAVSPTPSDFPPVIQTDRLILRPWEIRDAVGLRRALVESVGYLEPWVPWASSDPTTLERAYELLLGWIRDFRVGRSYIFAVFELSDAALVGGVGLYPRVGPAALEIGYWIRRSRAGSGLATEASGALTQVGFALPGVLRLEMRVDPANRPSLRIPEKLGYRRLDAHRVAEKDPKQTTVFVLSREEHRARTESARTDPARSIRAN